MKTRILLAVVAVVLLVGWWSTPPTLEVTVESPELPGELDSWLARREAEADRSFGIVAGTEKRIRWHGEPGSRTDYAVIYLHGFSGSRVELAPVPELVASAIGANLFETRLTGHGRKTSRMANIKAEAWLADGVEALAVGREIGDRLIVVGTSTGATLALALADHELFDAVEALVLVSPNLGFDDPAADWLTRPFGPLIARATVGEYREFEPLNAAQEKYWTTRYPTAAIVEMMRLLELAEVNVATASVPRALLVYSTQDRVVSPTRYLAAFEALRAADKQRFEITESADPAWHVLAGDVLSPTTTRPMAARIVRFLTER